MTKITIETGHYYGASDCGRVTACSFREGAKIDGREAWRGLYIDSATGFADPGQPVSAADWTMAKAVMGALMDAEDAAREASRQRQDDQLAARDEIAEKIARTTRGTAYDPNAR